MKIAIVLIALCFIWILVWVLHGAWKDSRARHQRLVGHGFMPCKHEAMKANLSSVWGPFTGPIYAKKGDGYTLWLLENPAGSGIGLPFMVATFDPEINRPHNTWIVPARQGKNGLADTMRVFLRTGGKNYNLPVPEAYQSKWWAWSARHEWAPSEPVDLFWETLSKFPMLSVQFKRAGLRFDVLAATHETESDQMLTHENIMSGIESVVQSLMTAPARRVKPDQDLPADV